MPGQSIPGAIFGAFRSDKPDIRWSTVDPERQRRLGGIWSEYDVSASPAGKADYLAAYAAKTPEAGKIAAGNLGFLNQYATGAYDPTKSYADILNLNQQALGNFLINPALADLTRQRKEAQARGGYGGQGAGTYDQLLQSRTLQQLASQAVPNLLGYTTAAYGTAGQLGQQNFLNRMGIIGSGEQYRQLDIPALRYLEPTRLARSNIQANLENLGAIARQEDLNRAYYRQPGLAERIGRGFNEVQSATYNEGSDILSLYNQYRGAVGGGSIPAGAGGAGASASTGGRAPAVNYSPYGTQPYNWGPSGNYGDPTTNVPYNWGTAQNPYESKPPITGEGGGGGGGL
jgi:hypothetical protein